MQRSRITISRCQPSPSSFIGLRYKRRILSHTQQNTNRENVWYWRNNNEVHHHNHFIFIHLLTCRFCCSLTIGLLILLTIVATIHDSFLGAINTNKRLFEILHCFSAKRNVVNLLSTKENPNNKDNVSCLYGIRFISMILLIMFHSSYTTLPNIKNTRTLFKVIII